MAETSEEVYRITVVNPNAAVIDVDEQNGRSEKGVEVLERGGGSVDEVEFRGGSSMGLRRDRPFSASVVSRQSVKSTQSRASLSPSLITTDFAARHLFAHRAGLIDEAVTVCKKSLLNDLDGELKGFWLLTEIDHWDLEKEKLVLLTQNSLIIAKYDFIALAVGKFRRLMLRSISRLQIGDLTYPSYSMMPPRQHGGIRIHWVKSQPSLAQKWNPWCDDLGYMTLTYHLLIYNEKEKETTTFNVSDLSDSLIEAVNATRRQDGVSDRLSVDEGPIVVESYASLSSMVYNQSHIGFNMQRGGVSF